MVDGAHVRAFMQVYLAKGALDPKVGRHNAHGGSDLEVIVGVTLRGST
ncbi:hypothetical protein [uncultured Parasutterella sp.]|nr:hypothetical protein [uncultured Parasutterella sp.]